MTRLARRGPKPRYLDSRGRDLLVRKITGGYLGQIPPEGDRVRNGIFGGADTRFQG